MKLNTIKIFRINRFIFGSSLQRMALTMIDNSTFEFNQSQIVSIDEDASLQIESFAVAHLPGVVCGVTMGLQTENMSDRGGSRTYDLWNATQLICQLSYAVRLTLYRNMFT